ncbi:MAG: serine/threonine protein kinase [Verrucomicrobiales bacterium]|nr:serine/threonine protein kinase [Verrucomicrobiales bacterium]
MNYSYDGLFLFTTRAVTNNVTFITMDDESFELLHQNRSKIWDRTMHAELLDKLAEDNCAVVVMDTYFSRSLDSEKDENLARAMRRHHEIALRAGYRQMESTNATGFRPVLPGNPFFSAAGKNWGVSRGEPDADGITRHHWPFPSPGAFPSLAETAARTAGATVLEAPRWRWIRYYGDKPPWRRISYHLALKQPANFFHGQIVFVGVVPKDSAPAYVTHKVLTPYSHWTGQATAGTEFLITEFLNRLNRESLYRSSVLDLCGLLIAGALIGGMLPRFRFMFALLGAFVAAGVVLGLAVALTANSNLWFPWLLVVVGQIPIAIVWTAFTSLADESTAVSRAIANAPKIPGYRVVEPAFAQGSYGKVWLARNKKGEWRAVKVVALNKFENDRGPYDREYEGVTRYQQISDKHRGLLRVELVSEKFATHFYYIMELADPVDVGWEKSPANYKPRDLTRVISLAPNKRLPAKECRRIAMILSDTLDFIHRAGFTHRDIKPQNIVFVNGQPKLADLGLITGIRTSDQQRTAVGTPGYMPPAPELPGTAQADVYALGMVLYVISTGNSPALFPDISSTLLDAEEPTEFLRLNTVVLKACQPDPKERYPSARAMFCALEQLTSDVVAA